MSKKLFLNRNEVAQGPAPECLSVLKNFKSHDLAFYFNGHFGSSLIPKLSKQFNVPATQIIIGYGAEDILRTIFNTLRPNTDSVLTHEQHFGYYDKYTNFRNIKIETFKLIEWANQFGFDIDDCIKKAKNTKTKVILVTSPNNPTGNSISCKDLTKILRSVNKNILVVLDEAYFGFDESYNEKSFISLLAKYDNLIILRSFSKIYALAGLRVGFALCGKKVKQMINYQNLYLGGSKIIEGIAATALASKKYYQNLSNKIISNRHLFISQINQLKHFRAYNSNANFVLIKIHSGSQTKIKSTINKLNFCISKFISNELIRVSLGSPKHTKNFLITLIKIDNIL